MEHNFSIVKYSQIFAKSDKLLSSCLTIQVAVSAYVFFGQSAKKPLSEFTLSSAVSRTMAGWEDLTSSQL
jgi:hypothetical protein